MSYWLVQHDIEAYVDRPNAIGSPKARASRDSSFRMMKKGDKLVYYVKGKRALGLFEVCSEKWFELKRWSQSRPDPHMAYEIKPIIVTIAELDPSDFDIATTRGRTALRLEPDQYRKMVKHILGTGDPENHEGTVSLFAKLHKACGFPELLKVGQDYPDIVAHDKERREVRIEVEFESVNFQREHMGEIDKCDLVVCWRDNWGRAAVKPVIELASILY